MGRIDRRGVVVIQVLRHSGVELNVENEGAFVGALINRETGDFKLRRLVGLGG